MAEFDVALRKESVDRNTHRGHLQLCVCVALRKESVDRNYRCRCPRYSRYCVALRKESVDRNPVITPTGHGLSSRSPQGERG